MAVDWGVAVAVAVEVTVSFVTVGRTPKKKKIMVRLACAIALVKPDTGRAGRRNAADLRESRQPQTHGAEENTHARLNK